MRITLTEATAAKTLPQLINEFITRKKADGITPKRLKRKSLKLVELVVLRDINILKNQKRK